MNALQTLLLVWAAGGVLSRTGNTLHLDTKNGAIPSELREAIRVNKSALLAILPAHTDDQSNWERAV